MRGTVIALYLVDAPILRFWRNRDSSRMGSVGGRSNRQRAGDGIWPAIAGVCVLLVGPAIRALDSTFVVAAASK
jgi:hypothetical protein